MQGGAYGSSASSNPISGSFVFSSYRDPNLKKTLIPMMVLPTYLKDLKVDDAELTKAIVAAIGDFDSPFESGPEGYGVAAALFTRHDAGTEEEVAVASLERVAADWRASATGWRL